jgi:triacylglycerol lipase
MTPAPHRTCKRGRYRWPVRTFGATAALALAFAAPAAAEMPLPSPGISPPGANDPSCRLTDEHPHPVVLVHGTFEDMTMSWNLVSPKLVADGYCVYALDYGNRATAHVKKSARELRKFIDTVLQTTGAQKVSIVGHSQGGMMPRYYAKFMGGARHIDDLIGLAPSNHGTDTPLAPFAGGGCPSCADQIAGSDFLTKLNAGDETPGRVSYTVVETKYDEVVTPYTSAFLADGPRTTNVLLQDKCPLDLSEHVSIQYDPAALQWVENALGRKGPARAGFKPDCL